MSTPGPWEWWTSNSWRRLRSNPANGRDAGVVTPIVARDGHPDLEVSAADMALIATAPELLDVVRAILHVSEHGPYDPSPLDENSPLIDAARAAIAKAEGRA
jgi:hypothetical protein